MLHANCHPQAGNDRLGEPRGCACAARTRESRLPGMSWLCQGHQGSRHAPLRAQDLCLLMGMWPLAITRAPSALCSAWLSRTHGAGPEPGSLGERLCGKGRACCFLHHSSLTQPAVHGRWGASRRLPCTAVKEREADICRHGDRLLQGCPTWDAAPGGISLDAVLTFPSVQALSPHPPSTAASRRDCAKRSAGALQLLPEPTGTSHRMEERCYNLHGEMQTSESYS